MADAIFMNVYSGTTTQINAIPIANGNLLFDETTHYIYKDDNGVRHVYGRSIESETVVDEVTQLQTEMGTAQTDIGNLQTATTNIQNNIGNTSYSSKGSTITEALSNVPRVYYGTTNPTSSIGVNGDLYIKISS